MHLEDRAPGVTETAVQLWEDSTERGPTSDRGLTLVLASLARSGDFAGVLRVFEKSKARMTPSAFAWTTAFSAAIKTPDLKRARQFWEQAQQECPSVRHHSGFLGTTMQLLAAEGDIMAVQSAWDAFLGDSSHVVNPQTQGIFLSILSPSGDHVGALAWFDKLSGKIKPSPFTWTSVIVAAVKAAMCRARGNCTSRLHVPNHHCLRTSPLLARLCSCCSLNGVSRRQWRCTLGSPKATDRRLPSHFKAWLTTTVTARPSNFGRTATRTANQLMLRRWELWQRARAHQSSTLANTPSASVWLPEQRVISRPSCALLTCCCFLRRLSWPKPSRSSESCNRQGSAAFMSSPLPLTGMD